MKKKDKTHQKFFELVVRRLFIHPLDHAALLLDLVEVVAGMWPRHSARIRATAPARLFWPSEPCVQLKHRNKNIYITLEEFFLNFNVKFGLIMKVCTIVLGMYTY